MRDITSFMEQFITLILNAFVWIFNTLDSIKFGGISILSYLVTLLILGTIIPLLFTIPQNNIRSGKTRKEKGEKNGK